MTIKLLGALLILGSGGCAALLSVRHQHSKIYVLEAWIDLIRHIRGQIDCYLTPLEDILACADLRRLHACIGGTSRDLRELLQDSLPLLDGEGRRLLSGFVSEVGGSYREEQVKRCEHYLGELQIQRNDLAAELPAKSKVSVALCVCFSVGAAILLW